MAYTLSLIVDIWVEKNIVKKIIENLQNALHCQL